MPHTKQRHALVVGGTRGIGRAVVKAMLDVGYSVSVIGRSPLQGMSSRKARWWQADLRDTEALPDLCAAILKEGGPLQSLVFVQRFRGNSEDAWQGELEVSLTATKTIIETVSPRFRRAKANAIVIVGSIAAQFVADEQSVGYHAAKGALRQLTRYYACVLGPLGIRVNSVSPGVILKPEAEKFYSANKKLVSLYERLAPLRGFGRAADVAKVVRFLCTSDSEFITGQDIVVDGGISLAWQASLARALIPIEIVSA